MEVDVAQYDELLIEEITLLGELFDAISNDTLHLVEWLGEFR